MRLVIDFPRAEEILARLDTIQSQLATLIQQEATELADLTNITTAVQNETTVDESAIALINGLADQIRANAADPAALQSLADNLTAESSKLAAAVAANTPAAPAPAA